MERTRWRRGGRLRRGRGEGGGVVVGVEEVGLKGEGEVEDGRRSRGAEEG